MGEVRKIGKFENGKNNKSGKKKFTINSNLNIF